MLAARPREGLFGLEQLGSVPEPARSCSASCIRPAEAPPTCPRFRESLHAVRFSAALLAAGESGPRRPPPARRGRDRSSSRSPRCAHRSPVVFGHLPVSFPLGHHDGVHKVRSAADRPSGTPGRHPGPLSERAFWRSPRWAVTPPTARRPRWRWPAFRARTESSRRRYHFPARPDRVARGACSYCVHCLYAYPPPGLTLLPRRPAILELQRPQAR